MQAESDPRPSYDLSNCYLTKPIAFERFIDPRDAHPRFWLSRVSCLRDDMISGRIDT